MKVQSASVPRGTVPTDGPQLLQPLIREAADGDARNVLLLLEAGADLEAAQENKIGFTALNQAVRRGRVLPRLGVGSFW